MKHDERLVEAVARAIMETAKALGGDTEIWPGGAKIMARVAFDAINASGIAWIAPWEATDAMLAGYLEKDWMRDHFADMRDTHLAEQGERECGQ